MANLFRLILQSGAGMGTEYPLEKPELILGRDQAADVVINDPEVSRRHVRLVLEGATYRMEDLGSTNGTFIQGQRLSAPVLLKPGEIITLGEKVVLRYDVINTDPNATVVAPRGLNKNTQAVVRQPSAPPVTPVVPIVAPPVQNFQPAPVAPVYEQRIASTPMPVPMPIANPKKESKALITLLVIAGLIVLFLVIPWIIIDATSSYCNVIPGITNFFSQIFYGGEIACP